MGGSNNRKMGKRAAKQRRRMGIQKVNAIRRMRMSKIPNQGCSSDAAKVNCPNDASNTSRRKPDLNSTSSRMNTTVNAKTISTSQKVATSSLYFNNSGLEDDNNKETERIYQGISKDDILINIDINDDNLPDPLSSETSMGKDIGDQLGDNSDSCLICGDIQTIKDAKQAASSFQWNINGNEHDAQNDGLSLDSCVDVHLLPMFVLRTLLKFPKEECVKIYKRTFGVSNPADWFILCRRCVKAVHKSYQLQVLIRQLEKKFEVWQEEVLNRVKANVRKTVPNDNMSNTNVITVREQILDFYSEKILTDSTQFKPCENILPPSLTQNDCESLDFVDTPSPKTKISPALRKIGRQKMVADYKYYKNPEMCTLTKTRPYLIYPNIRDAVKLKNLTMKKNQDELIARHEDPMSPNTYRCKLCPPQFNSVFETKLGFTTHLSRAHKPAWESVAEYVQCEHCGKSLTVSSLKTHVRTHHFDLAAYPHICHLCGRGYATKSLLNFHITRHSKGMFGTHNEVCHYCGLECKSKHGLNVHVKRFHRQNANGSKGQGQITGRAGITPERPCKHCDVVCASFRELQLHLKNVHPELLKYKCEECDAAYISKANLRVHVDSIHRQAKLQCKNCPNVLSTAAAMCGHVKYNCRGFSNQIP